MTPPQDTVYPENQPTAKTKFCSKCGAGPMLLENFVKDNRRPDGRTNVCKSCCHTHTNNYRAMIRNNPLRERELNAQQIITNDKGEQCKLCSKCKSIKLLNDFFRCSNPSGYKSRCKECSEKDRQKRTSERISARESSPIISSKVCTNHSCLHLGESQPVSNFFTNTGSRDGFMYQCKDCVKKTNAKWTSENIDYRREISRIHHRRYYRETQESKWHIRVTGQLRQRAKKKGLPFDMKASDLLDPKTMLLPEFCPIFPHIKLDYSAGPDRRTWASVDKIVPQLGYTKGNVWVISMSANVWKDNGSNQAERERIVQIMRGQVKTKKEDNQTGFLFPE